jgi:hypothetical protein
MIWFEADVLQGFIAEFDKGYRNVVACVKCAGGQRIFACDNINRYMLTKENFYIINHCFVKSDRAGQKAL